MRMPGFTAHTAIGYMAARPHGPGRPRNAPTSTIRPEQADPWCCTCPDGSQKPVFGPYQWAKFLCPDPCVLNFGLCNMY